MSENYDAALRTHLAGMNEMYHDGAETSFEAGWQACSENDKQAEPVAVDHSGLIKRIDAAIERVTKGWGLMTIPADPRSDVDLVLSECKALLQGENPPFWATDFHPPQPVAVDVGNLEYMGNSVSFIYQKMRAYKDGMGKVWQALRDNGIHPDGQTHAADAIRKALAQPAQPVQPAACQYCNGTGDVHGIDGEWRGECKECKPAGAQGEPNSFFAGWQRRYKYPSTPGQVCAWESCSAKEATDPFEKKPAYDYRKIYTEAPAVAVNEYAMNWKPLDAHAQSGRTVLLANLEAESMRDDNNVPFVFSDYWHQYRDNGCWESWNELFDEQPTHYCEIAAAEPPAAAINEQLLEALKELMYARTDKAEGMAEAAIAAAEAEKAKGGAA